MLNIYIVSSQALYRFYFPAYNLDVNISVHVLRVSAKYLKSNENMTAYDVWSINCHVLKSVKCFKYQQKAFTAAFYRSKMTLITLESSNRNINIIIPASCTEDCGVTASSFDVKC